MDFVIKFIIKPKLTAIITKFKSTPYLKYSQLFYIGNSFLKYINKYYKIDKLFDYFKYKGEGENN